MYQRAISAITKLRTRLQSSRGRPNSWANVSGIGPNPGATQHAAHLEGAQSLIDALSDAALILDARGIVLVANTNAQEAFGRLFVGEHIGRTARHPELAEAIKSSLINGQTTTFELALKTPTDRHLDGNVSRLSGFGEGPDAPTLVVILQDISEREALARMRIEFVANASHELRTPLAALSGFIETLRGPARDDPAARERFLGIMFEQAQRMTRLIDDLLLLSRVEMRAHLAPVTAADLNHVASEATRIAAPLAHKEGTVLRLQLTDTDVKLPGDHDELMQAVSNLIQNALKYGRSGGTIVVKTARDRDRRGAMVARLSVIDDGPGISAEHLPRLTERFYRINSAASREKGGTGLGLAIVKHIAARHRGQVEIQSVPSQGSTFSLVFPLPGAST
jgi:two-component system, OmpR family, phosphate regulon sensor histidine kinase PhoR